jgi:hypothetical protein
VKLRRSRDLSHTSEAHVNQSGQYMLSSHLDLDFVEVSYSSRGPGYDALPGRLPGPIISHQHISHEFEEFSVRSLSSQPTLHDALTCDVMLWQSLQMPRVVKGGQVQLPEGQVKSEGSTELYRPAYAARAMSVSEQLLLPRHCQLCPDWSRL